MRMIVPIIGAAAIVVQVLRLLPVTFTSVLTALVTGGIFYLACKLGWDTQKGTILRDGYTGWKEWGKRALLGTTVFLTLALTLLFLSFHNPICADTGEPFYGRCEKYGAESTEAGTDVSFSLGKNAFYPLLLALAFYTGSASVRIEHTKKKGVPDRRTKVRRY